MFSKVTISSVLFALSMSTTAVADEMPLDQYLASMVAQQVESTRLELSFQTQEQVLTASHYLGLEDEPAVKTLTTITDLDLKNAIAMKRTAE